MSPAYLSPVRFSASIRRPSSAWMASLRATNLRSLVASCRARRRASARAALICRQGPESQLRTQTISKVGPALGPQTVPWPIQRYFTGAKHNQVHLAGMDTLRGEVPSISTEKHMKTSPRAGSS